jgi:hypothetical protein
MLGRTAGSTDLPQTHPPEPRSELAAQTFPLERALFSPAPNRDLIVSCQGLKLPLRFGVQFFKTPIGAAVPSPKPKGFDSWVAVVRKPAPAPGP